MDTPREFDTVELLVPVSEPDGLTFPAGTRAAIVDLRPGADYALVEIVRDDGMAYGPFGVALVDLRVIEHAHAAG
ncbi:MAG TPA: hypothetical protein VNY31_03105 [Solirubrobacteraceae bacterium]|jgi:hypothetical protein|nr:hypothetical protein [Solirubrobacteraceae bacterium]